MNRPRTQTWRIIGMVLLAAAAGVAQSQAGAALPEAFAAVSIKAFRRTPSTASGKDQTDPAGLHWVDHSLRDLICRAYGIEQYQLNAGGKWTAGEAFNLDASTSAPTTTEQMMTMLRGVLADRFGLQLEHRTEATRVLALVVAAGGPPLRPAARDAQPHAESAPSNMYRFQVQTIHQLAEMLNGFNGFGKRGPVVVDKTGMTGRYDLTVGIPIVSAAAAAGGNSGEHLDYAEIPSAVKRIGLELKPMTVPLVMYTIESAHEPTAN